MSGGPRLNATAGGEQRRLGQPALRERKRNARCDAGSRGATDRTAGAGLAAGRRQVRHRIPPAATVTATLDTPAPATGLTLTTGGTATLATDYTLSSTTITLAAGETAGTVTITVIDDGETIVLDAASTTPALTAEPLTLTIEDNDVMPVPALPRQRVLWLGLLLTVLGAAGLRLRDRPRTDHALVARVPVRVLPPSTVATPPLSHSNQTA